MGAEIMGENQTMYVSINVMKRASDHVVVYRCFQRLSDGAYFVQSADRVWLPVQLEKLQSLETQFWELLIEDEPETRSSPALTLQDAIRAFDACFES